MKTRVFSVALVGLAVVLAGLAAVAAEKPLEGTIASAADGKLAVRAEGEQYNFVVAEDAKITLDGKACKFADLKAGQRVKVTWEKKGNEQLATKIEAKAKADKDFSFVAFLADDEATHEGTVASAANGNLAVKVGDQQHNFTVNENTKITLDGKEAKFSDLKAGQRVKVTSIKQGDKMLARTIAARAAE